MAIDSGATAFIIISMALVNLMTPGLAFFYGGLVRQQNVLTIIMQNFVSMGLVTIIWVIWGFSLCFGEGGVVIGNPGTHAMLTDMYKWDGDIPGLVFAGASPPRTRRETRPDARAAPQNPRPNIRAEFAPRTPRNANARAAPPRPIPDASSGEKKKSRRRGGFQTRVLVLPDPRGFDFPACPRKLARRVTHPFLASDPFVPASRPRSLFRPQASRPCSPSSPPRS
jgi:hypothetical protein